MFFLVKNKTLITLMMLMAICSLFAGTGYGKTEKEKNLVTINKIKNGYVNAGKNRYLIMESTKVTDITGKKIPFYMIPIPGKAELVFQSMPDIAPHLLEIIVQQEIRKEVIPE